jgi:hypothetical protein
VSFECANRRPGFSWLVRASLVSCSREGEIGWRWVLALAKPVCRRTALSLTISSTVLNKMLLIGTLLDSPLQDSSRLMPTVVRFSLRVEPAALSA